MSALIIDIETIGEAFDSLDETTQQSLTRWISKESATDSEYSKSLEDLKNGLGFSPLTGEIVVIGVMDYEKNKGVVYFQDRSQSLSGFEDNDFKYKPETEAEMLNYFWRGAEKYDEFITFNGRSFDIPFIMVRSAVNNIKPTKDLMSNRYLGSQKFDAVHVDLLEQLSFYGAMRRKGNLHLWSRVFGIKSPKDGGITGDDVGRLFEEGNYKEIALYNAEDLRATRELYNYWNKYLRL